MLKELVQETSIKFFLGKYQEAGLNPSDCSILIDVGVDEDSNVHYQVLSLEPEEEKSEIDYEEFVHSSGLRFLLEPEKSKYFTNVHLTCEPAETDEGIQDILIFKSTV
ncbi:MAG: hypothetical protein DRQ40_04665 [Gammaproteobacteria bacterium]|nr:MAG: hypothetical protein DRQ40_04665 [Gammaproteobacteria bacterium]